MQLACHATPGQLEPNLWYSHLTWLTSAFHSNSVIAVHDSCAERRMTHLLKLAVCKRSLKVFKEPPSHKVHFILPSAKLGTTWHYRHEFAGLQGTSSLNSSFAFLRTDWKVLHAMLTLTNDLDLNVEKHSSLMAEKSELFQSTITSYHR